MYRLVRAQLKKEYAEKNLSCNARASEQISFQKLSQKTMSRYVEDQLYIFVGIMVFI